MRYSTTVHEIFRVVSPFLATFHVISQKVDYLWDSVSPNHPDPQADNNKDGGDFCCPPPTCLRWCTWASPGGIPSQQSSDRWGSAQGDRQKKAAAPLKIGEMGLVHMEDNKEAEPVL